MFTLNCTQKRLPKVAQIRLACGIAQVVGPEGTWETRCVKGSLRFLNKTVEIGKPTVRTAEERVRGRFLWIPLRHWLFTPESQWQPRGKRRISQGWV